MLYPMNPFQSNLLLYLPIKDSKIGVNGIRQNTKDISVKRTDPKFPLMKCLVSSLMIKDHAVKHIAVGDFYRSANPGEIL